ncbi:MAG: YjjG family noncanonical pyrimidine nucleotidase [Bacteroidota bacterium]
MQRHLFFDLDRTLWDFEANSKVALKHLFFDLKLDEKINNFELFYEQYKLKNAELWKLYGAGKLAKEELRTKRFADSFALFEIADQKLIEKMSDGYVAISPLQTQLFPGSIETLEQLKSDDYVLHIITNGFKEAQHIKLKNSLLTPFFDVIVCSEDIGKNKPNPEIFHYATQKAKARIEESVMIGDDLEIDIIGALNVGMKAILFDPENHYHNFIDGAKVKKIDEIPETLIWL